MKKTKEELSQMRQPAPPPATELPPPPTVAPAPVQPVTRNRLEPLYERFRKQHPPTFEGGPDPLGRAVDEYDFFHPGFHEGGRE